MATFYVGSLWHEDCDPFIGVIATTREQAEQALRDAYKDELETMLSQCDHTHADENGSDDCEECDDYCRLCAGDICDSGVQTVEQESLDDYLSYSKTLDEVAQELESIGYCYV